MQTQIRLQIKFVAGAGDFASAGDRGFPFDLARPPRLVRLHFVEGVEKHLEVTAGDTVDGWCAWK